MLLNTYNFVVGQATENGNFQWLAGFRREEVGRHSKSI
jgi:hypothetical protein